MPETAIATNLDSLRELMAACDCTDPAPEDVKALKKYIRANPDALNKVGDMCDQNIDRLTRKAGWTSTARELTQADITRKLGALGYNESPELERMLISVIALTWLQLQEWNYRYTQLTGADTLSIAQAKFWEKRLTAALGRYLRATETLARVRKLARQDPALQLNITQEGGQAVNVAGDLNRGQP